MKKLSIYLMLFALLISCECPECPPAAECPECPDVPTVVEEELIENTNYFEGADTADFTVVEEEIDSIPTTLTCSSLTKYYKNESTSATISIDCTPCTNGQIQLMVFDTNGNWIRDKILKVAKSTTIVVPAGGKLYVMCSSGTGDCEVQITGVSRP